MEEDDGSWKKRAWGVWQACEGEFRRTTSIGLKMLQASRASSELHETYEELGRLVSRSLKDGSLEWKDPQVRVLVCHADELEALLQEMEGEVQDLKKPPV